MTTMIAATPATPLPLAPTSLAAPASRRASDFDHVLGRARAAPAGDEATNAARDLVAITLVEPLLEQLRESSQAAPPFAPSRGEKQFRAMLDANLAREITGAARFPLVERLARDLRSRGSTDAPITPNVQA